MWTLIILVFGINFGQITWVPGFSSQEECLHAIRSVLEIGSNVNAVCVLRTGK